LAIPLAQITDIFGIALVSSLILSIIAIALTFKILVLTDVSSPWKLAGSGFIVSMLATLILVYNLFRGGPGSAPFLAHYFFYLTTGVLIYASLWKLERVSNDPLGAGLG
jgi:hypothetical protein